MHPRSWLALPLVCLATTISLSSAAQAAFWWQDVQPEPAGTIVGGIEIGTFADDWVAARALTLEDIPEIHGEARPRSGYDDYSSPFEVTADFDDDGDIETARVVVFQRRDGSTGNALVIIGPQGVEYTWRTHTRQAYINFVGIHRGQLYYAYCDRCDGIVDVVSDAKDDYRIVKPEMG